MREMKDSGVEWIGEIPEDWNVGKTLYALSMPITDGPHETPELFDEGIPFISAEAVSCGNGHFLSFSKELVRLYCIVLLDVLNSSAISVSFIPSK